MDDAAKAELLTEELILIHEVASAAFSSLQIEEVCEGLATELNPHFPDQPRGSVVIR